jgi:UDP-N-acetylglucosamine--N-acetylmuramyl-(pentapeptide) pyrophosphoryl-undecaprenol N-acetylglucosamine transferase
VKLIIAGGGTGGHLFPGIAVAEELMKRSSANDVLFIGTDRGLEQKVLKDLGLKLRTLDVAGIKGKGLIGIFTALCKLPRSILDSYRIIKSFRPDMVMGVGGYASGPAVVTAHFMRITTGIMEQNAIAGMTNRILGKFADRVFLTFPDTEKRFPEKKTVICGNPVRSAFLAERTRNERKEDRFTVLIFGGSQGAQAINIAVLDSLPYLRKLREYIKIIHQTGERDFHNVSTQYEKSDMEAEAVPFIMDMATAYRSSNLIICRAGATSIAEITVSGKAAILVPFPFAVNDHQTKNAEVLVRAQAALMIREKDLSGKKLAETIGYLYHHTDIIKDMEINSSRLGNRKAASDIVDACEKMVM